MLPQYPPPASTSVVRFWWEWSRVPLWRGQITRLESGQRVAFLDLGKVERFIQDLGERVSQLSKYEEFLSRDLQSVAPSRVFERHLARPG